MQKIKNIIFDLGGVILNIDLKRTELAFAELGIGNFKEYYTLQHSSPLFHNLELGLITPGIFFEQFRYLVQLPLTDEQIRTAWNALLLDFPPERMHWLNQISKRHNIYLYRTPMKFIMMPSQRFLSCRLVMADLMITSSKHIIHTK